MCSNAYLQIYCFAGSSASDVTVFSMVSLIVSLTSPAPSKREAPTMGSVCFATLTASMPPAQKSYAAAAAAAARSSALQRVPVSAMEPNSASPTGSMASSPGSVARVAWISEGEYERARVWDER